MSIARETILRRIHAALHDVPKSERPEEVGVVRTYRTVDETPPAELVAQFAERVAEYKAKVKQVTADALPQAIGNALQGRGSIVVPADLPDTWRHAVPAALVDSGQLNNLDLDESQGVLTGCVLGIAQTGTIVLDHGLAQGRRAISLVPDYHLCIIAADQIVGLVPEAITRLEPSVRAGRPLTFISGPSATSDIELNRVEGVHGPRTLEVLIVV